MATLGPSVASDIFTIGRTLLVLCAEFRGYQRTYEFRAPAGRGRPRPRSARLAVPAAAQGLRARPGRPVHVRRGAAAAAARRAARGRGDRDARASRRPPRRRPSSRRPTVADGHATTGRQLPRLRHGPVRPAGRLAVPASASSTPCSASRRSTRRRGCRPRCCWPARTRRWRPNNRKLADDCVRQLLLNDPWEWRAVWMAGLVALQGRDFADGPELVQRRLRPGARRAGAQAGARARLRARRRAGHRREPLPHLRLHRRQLRRRRRRSAWPGSGPRAATSPGRSQRSTWCRTTSPRLPRVAAAAGAPPGEPRRHPRRR